MNKYGAAGLLITVERKIVLLGRRSKICANLSGMWSMPCGVIEGEESPKDTAIREFFEETGVLFEGEVSEITTFPCFNSEGLFHVFHGEANNLLFPSEKAIDAIEHDEWGYFRVGKMYLPSPMTKDTENSILMLK